MSLGNVIGSNLFNIALVASCAPWISLGFGGVLPRWVGMLLVYLGWVYRAGRRAGAEEAELATAEVQTTLGIDPMAPERPARVWGTWLSWSSGSACWWWGHMGLSCRRSTSPGARGCRNW